MTPEQLQTLQRLTEQMDEMIRWQAEETAKADARQAQRDAERAGNKRTMLAAAALSGLLASGTELGEESMALCAVASADALLRALANPVPSEERGQ